MTSVANKPEVLIYSIITICFLAILLMFLKWKSSRRHLYSLAARVPVAEGIWTLPIIGHGVNVVGTLEELIAKSRVLFAELKPPRKLWLFHELMFLINRAEDVEIILNSKKCLSKHHTLLLSERFLGRGLLILPATEWKIHRKIIMPTFKPKILEGFVHIFSKYAETLTDILRTRTGEIINIFEFTSKYSLDVICETAMGIEIKAQTHGVDISKTINRLMEITTNRATSFLYHFDWIYNFSKLSKEEIILSDIYKKFILEVIEKKLSEYRNQMNLKRKEKSTFLDLLIDLTESGDKWTNDEFFAEVSTIMVAGSDTTSTITAFAMVLLGMHKDIQEKCFDEIVSVLKMDQQITYTDLPKFVYLEQVIKETMRLFPAAPTIYRQIDEDMEVGGYVLPKGSSLTLYILVMHYSEEYFKNPWKFDPDRFTPEETTKRHKYAYLPFSGGPRNCIGAKFGMMSMKTMLANVIRNFKIETTYENIKDIRIQQTIVIKAIEGYPIRLIPRL